MVDGVVIKGYSEQKLAVEHAEMINQQALQFGKEAYVEQQR